MSGNKKIEEVLPSDEEEYQDALSKTNEEIVADIIRESGEQTLDEDDNKTKCEGDNKKEDFKDCLDFAEDDETEEKKLLEETMTDEEKLENRKKAESLRLEGNELFRNQKYEESIHMYTSALKTIPTQYLTERSILYSNRAAAKIKLESTKSAIDDCTKAIELDDHYVKAILRRAKLYEETDKLDESMEDYQQVLKLDPGNREANEAVVRLPPKIKERNEKLKEEMIDKLKDLGNMILKPFGLSTSNFELQKNPESEGYSINFKQNPQ